MRLLGLLLLVLVLAAVALRGEEPVPPPAPPPAPPSPFANGDAPKLESLSDPRKERARIREEAEEKEAKEPVPDPFKGQEITIAPRPEAPPAVCTTCDNTGRLYTEMAKRAYILFENQDLPEPELSLGWKPCPNCARGKAAQRGFDDERLRLGKRTVQYSDHEKRFGMQFIDFETRVLTGHFQATLEETRECAAAIDRFAGMIRTRCGHGYLGASPDTQHLVVCENEEKYLKYMEVFAQNDGNGDQNWQELAKKSASFGSRNITVIRRDLLTQPQGAGLGHMVVFSSARMLIREATNNHAPHFFAEGFASLAESLAYGSNYCYSIRYEDNKLNFDGAWAKSMQEGVRANKVLKWDALFNQELVGMSVLMYQQCWSVVRYLYETDGAAFDKLPALFKEGLTPAKAIEKAYGKSIDKLEKAWRTWAALGR